MKSNSLDEERELLMLQCRLARLKLTLAQQRRAPKHSATLFRFADNALMVRRTPLWKFTALPRKRRTRFVLTAIVLLWQFWRAL